VGREARTRSNSATSTTCMPIVLAEFENGQATLLEQALAHLGV
jgi:hypothetical protein